MARTRKTKRPKPQPMRTCLGCQAKRPKRELVRVVRIPSGAIELDLSGRKAGRGAYVCPNSRCLELAVKARRLERALESPVPAEVLASLTKAIRVEASVDEPAMDGPGGAR